MSTCRFSRKMSLGLITGTAAFVVGLSACSSLPHVPTGPHGYRIVAASEDRTPSWIDDMGHWSREKKQSKEGAVWFVASSPLENSLQGARHDAYIRAQRKASDRIGDQNWDLVGNTVKRKLGENTQTMMRVKDETKTRLRQASQGWLVGGEEYQYFWTEYQPKHPNRVSPDMRTLYRAWALVRYNHNNWECSRRNSLKLLPMIANNLGGPLEYKKFDSKQFQSVIQDIVSKNLSLIPGDVCVRG